MRAAVLFLRSEKLLLLSIVFACLVNAVLAGVNVVLPYVVTEQLAWNAAADGIAEAIGGVGALAGSAFVGLAPGFCTMKRFPAFNRTAWFWPSDFSDGVVIWLRRCGSVCLLDCRGGMDSFLGKCDYGGVGERYSASMRERHGRACAGVVLCCGHLRFSCGAGSLWRRD